MAPLAQPLPIIRPITDLRTKLNEVCEQATESRLPIVLTKNGQSAYVLMDSNAYNASEHATRIHLALREAELEERYRPETLTQKESDARMREIFAQWGLSYA